MAILLDKSGNISDASKFGGLSAVRARTASKFVPTGMWTVDSADVSVKEDTGTPSGNIQIQVLGDVGGLPDNSNVIGTAAVITPASTNSNFQTFNRTFTPSLSLSPGVTYWFTFRVASGENDSNYYSSQSDATSTTDNGAQYNEPSAGQWTLNNEDLYYVLNGSAGVQVTATVVTATFSVPSPTVLIGVDFTATVITSTFSVISPTVTTVVGNWVNQTKNQSSWINQSKS